MATITAPAILMVIDDSIDVSLFYDVSEEEEEKGNEKNKELDILVVNLNSEFEDSSSSKIQKNLGYCYKKYPKPHLNLISPPPEHNIS